MTRLVLPGLVLLLVLKALAAARLDFFGDESFYWLCSRRLGLSYSDHPPMTALLLRGGTELLGDTPLGARLLFLVLGALFPFLVLLLARQLTGARDALLAAGAALLVPVTAHLGVVAVPDVPLLFLLTLSLLFLVRALAPSTRFAHLHWLLAGGAAGLAIATHYRALLLPLALLVHLVSSRAGRARLRTAGPWLFLIGFLPGTVPPLWFNVKADFAPLLYQGVERHEEGFQLAPLLEQIPLQMVAVTPLLYVALLGALALLWSRARQGDAAAAFLRDFALLHLVLFLVAAPFSDSDHATLHWPAPGYVPLLVLLPAALRWAADRGGWRRLLAILAPASAALVILLLFVELTFHPFGMQALERPFAGWREAAAATERRLVELEDLKLTSTSGQPILVADNYMLAGSLDRLLAAPHDLYVLDHPKNKQHGRSLQFLWWKNGEEALRRRRGENALLVAQRSQTRSRNQKAWHAHMASFFARLDRIASVETPGGRGGENQHFDIYYGVGIR